MKEAIIRTEFGEIRIQYQSMDELNNQLQDLEQEVKAIQEAGIIQVPSIIRKSKPGCENIYRFISNNVVELLRVPEKLRDAVAIVLFAYHPEMVTSAELEQTVGKSELARNVLSTGSNKEYFRQVNDKYGLTFNGLQLVTNTIIPSLSSTGESMPHEVEE